MPAHNTIILKKVTVKKKAVSRSHHCLRFEESTESILYLVFLEVGINHYPSISQVSHCA